MVALGQGLAQVHHPGADRRRATRGVLGGDVILLHDADFYSARALLPAHRRRPRTVLTELERRKLDTVLPV